jgi:branched-chain amino acid transport system substrate-binding protein
MPSRDLGVGRHSKPVVHPNSVVTTEHKGGTYVRTQRLRRTAAVVMVCGLIAAACGGDDETADTAAPGTTATESSAEAPESTEAPDTSAEGGETTLPDTSVEGDGTCAGGPDASLDETNGANAGWAAWALACAAESPLAAEGDPIVIGMHNPSGDPNGSFPEYETSAQAAVDFINNELGGIGADYATGTPGRPIELKICSTLITPDDSLRCANELAGENPDAVISTLNFFGNHFSVFAGAGIPVIVGTPITALDFTSPGVFAVGGGGGCLGVHTGLVDFVTADLGAKKVAVPWANTPPGVFCYNDLEKKPLNVLNGTTAAEGNDAAGTIPDLEHIGVPIQPGQADVTPQATQVLDFDPDGIIFSAQGADCWTLVNSLKSLGWTAAETPLVLSGACLDTEKAIEAGDAAKGIYFVGDVPITQPDALEGLLQIEAQTYVDKMDQYGAGDDTSKGFATQGFKTLMLIWEMGSVAAGTDPSSFSSDALVDALGATSNHHAFASTPQSCADAADAAPYVAVCNSLVTATQWNGESYDVIRSDFSGLYLIAGTELDLGQ